MESKPMKMPSTLKLVFGLSMLLLASFTRAELTCSTTNAALLGVADVVDPGTNLLASGPINPGYYANSCLIFEGENDDAGGLSEPHPNIGQLYDGLLNGEAFQNVNGGSPLFTGLEFIDPNQLQDLDGDGNFTDPGWIHLANINDGNISYSNAGPSPYIATSEQINIGDLINITFSCNAGDTFCSWTLTPLPGIVDKVQTLLGGATFDHLLFSVKTGAGPSTGGFAVYDFDFNQIFANELTNNPLSPLTLDNPYVLSGTISTGDFVNGENNPRAYSHINVWARDPQSSVTILISEPKSLTLLVLALGLLSVRRFAGKKH